MKLMSTGMRAGGDPWSWGTSDRCEGTRPKRGFPQRHRRSRLCRQVFGTDPIGGPNPGRGGVAGNDGGPRI